MRRNRPKPKTAIGAAAVVLVVVSLTPTRWSGWVTAFRGPLQTIVGPVSGTTSAVASWLRPATRRDSDRPEELVLLRQRDEALRALQMANQRIRELEERLELIEGFRLAARAPVQPRPTTVIGREVGAGTISVRGGRMAGDLDGSAVVDDGSLQLIGRVVGVGPTASTVRLLTAPRGENGGWVRGVVIEPGVGALSAEEQAALPRVDLRPVGGGVLESAEVGASSVLRPGAVVKLDDAAWPAEAQFFDLGVIEEVLETDVPLMSRVRVRPRIDDLGLVSRVVVLLPLEEGVGGGGSGGVR